MSKVRSAKGKIIDFNLLKIKESIAASPKTNDVRSREEFIEKRAHRRSKKLYPKVAPVKVEAKPVAQEKLESPVPIQSSDTEDIINEEPITKQKARPKNHK